MKILTYNVNWESCDEETGKSTPANQLVIQAIRKANPDIVLLQETHKGWNFKLEKI